MKEIVVGGISPKNPPKGKNSQIKIDGAPIHIPRNNQAKFQNYLMDGLGGVADKGSLYIYMYMKGFGGNFPPPNPPKMKKSQIKIASAHIPTLRNNQAKFHNNPMDSLGGVADKRFWTDGRTRVT